MDFLLSQNNLYIVLIAIASGAMLLWPALNRRGGQLAVSLPEAVQLANRENAVFLDIRSPDKYQAGTIAQARNIPGAEIDAKLNSLPKGKPIIVFCDQGRSSVAVATALRKKGFDQAVSLQSGMQGWVQAGMPVSKKH